MEVHAHSHTARKKWTHYFWEFLMLFLAVFCGFLAENQREHIVEHQREKKFARRLLSDLREDSVFFQKRVFQLQERKKAHELFLKTLTAPVRATDSEVLLNFFPLLRVYAAEIITATYSQMKTSGSLRYIQNDDLTTALQKYYEVQLPKTSREPEDVKKFFLDHITPYMAKHFRFQDLNSDSVKKINHVILDRTARSDQELINLMGMYDSACGAILERYKESLNQAIGLIELIKEEYHLK